MRARGRHGFHSGVPAGGPGPNLSLEVPAASTDRERSWSSSRARYRSSSPPTSAGGCRPGRSGGQDRAGGGGSQLRLRTAAEVALDAVRAGKSRDAEGPGGTRGERPATEPEEVQEPLEATSVPPFQSTSTGQSEPQRLAGLNKGIIIRQSGAAPAKEGSEGTRFRECSGKL